MELAPLSWLYEKSSNNNYSTASPEWMIDQRDKSFPTARKDIVIRQMNSPHILKRLTLNDASLSTEWVLSANTLGLSSGTHALQLEIFGQWITPQHPDWELSYRAMPKTPQDASIVVSIP